MKTGFGTSHILRRICCIALALVLLASAPVNAFAATYTVSSSEEMSSSWENASSNSDKKNTFYITNDITMDTSLTAQGDKTYIVSAQGNGDYDLSDVFINSDETGGTVIINTDVTSSEGAALTVLGNTVVAVNGDVTTTSKTKPDGNNPAVESAEGADVTILGDVNAAEAGLYANGGNITVKGDVALTSEGDAYNNYVIDADMGSNVVVTGNVTTEEYGALAMRDSEVVIYGDLTLESAGKADSNTNVISASDNGSVDVKGTVTSEEGGIVANEGTVTIGKDVVLDSKATGATAISAVNKTDITVGGNVESSGDAAYLYLDSILTVNGNVSSDGLTQISEGSDVKIYGNFDLSGDSGEGVLIVEKDSSLWMGNSTMLEAGFVQVSENSSVDAAFVNAEYAVVGAATGDSEDSSEFLAYTTTSDSDVAYLLAAGSSDVQIIGDVGDIDASQNAYVEIFGKAGLVNISDNAVVITEAASENPVSHLPAQSTEDYEVGDTTAHTIFEMCQGYTTNSTLHKQTSELRAVCADVSSAITGELNGGTVLWASLFDHEKINLSSYLSSRYTEHDFYTNPEYNATSRENFQEADSLNTYVITMYKDNLAQSLLDLNSGINQNLSKGVKLVMNILAFTKKFEDAADIPFTATEKKYLKNLTSGDGQISAVEMKDFLETFGYFTENDSGVNLAAQSLSRAYNKIAPIMDNAEVLAKANKYGLKLRDLVEYILTDYGNSIVVLDEILANQTLSPEMFAAAAELRATIEDKMLGSIEKTVAFIKEESIGKIKDMWSLLGAGQALIDIAGLITGGTKDSEDLQNGAALTIIAPELLLTLENAILNVKNGDTSEEAVQMVHMSYTMVRRTLANMCDVMTNIGDKEQEQKYETLLDQLNEMELGEFIDLV